MLLLLALDLPVIDPRGPRSRVLRLLPAWCSAPSTTSGSEPVLPLLSAPGLPDEARRLQLERVLVATTAIAASP